MSEKGQDGSERFHEIVNEWHEANVRLANKKIDLIEARRERCQRSSTQSFHLHHHLSADRGNGCYSIRHLSP